MSDIQEADVGLLSGRSPRLHVWAMLGVMLGGAFLLSAASAIAPSDDLIGLFAIVFIVCVNLGWIVVGIRRLNDMDRSRWWMLMILVPLFNVALLLALLFRAGEETVE